MDRIKSYQAACSAYIATLVAALLIQLVVAPMSVSYAGGTLENEGRKPLECPSELCPIRPQDEIWMVSTRHLGPCGDPCTANLPPLAYSRHVEGRGWVPCTADEFFAGDSVDRLTVTFVHGNRMSPAWVEDHGFKAYCMLSQQNCSARPMRFVIWSWPSDPIERRLRIIKDAQVKAVRTPMQSYYLGWWLSRMQPEQQVSLIGYSYGARTILGALHLLAGGELECRRLPQAPFSTTVTPNVTLWATACQSDWIVPGNLYGCATQKINCGLVLYNRMDPALRRYMRLLPESTGPALGLVGVNCAEAIPAANRLSEMNVGPIVRHHHEFMRYVRSSRIAEETRRFTFWMN